MYINTFLGILVTVDAFKTSFFLFVCTEVTADKLIEYYYY